MPVIEPVQLARTPLRGRLLPDEPMAKHVSWRAGGRAARAYVPADLADLQAFLRTLPPVDRFDSHPRRWCWTNLPPDLAAPQVEIWERNGLFRYYP